MNSLKKSVVSQQLDVRVGVFVMVIRIEVGNVSSALIFYDQLTYIFVGSFRVYLLSRFIFIVRKAGRFILW